jgi:hypothetical protein
MSNPYDGIIANIFIGGDFAANNFNYQFEMLVNCASGLNCPTNHKNCVHLPVHQDERFAKFYFDLIHESDVLDKIHQCVLQNKPVLIYCLQGMHRSCTLCACYIMKYHDLSVEQVMKFIKSKRSIAFNPVYNLIETMHLFYKHLHPHGHSVLQNVSLPAPSSPYPVMEISPAPIPAPTVSSKPIPAVINPKPVETPKPVEKPKSAEKPKPVEKPKQVENPKIILKPHKVTVPNKNTKIEENKNKKKQENTGKLNKNHK